RERSHPASSDDCGLHCCIPRGAVYVPTDYFAPETVHIFDSTFSSNHADVAGGGLYVEGGTLGASATLVNCTVSRNSAPRGGGVCINTGAFDRTGGRVKLLNTTLLDNDAPSGAAIEVAPLATAELGRTILAHSTTGTDCDGTIVSLGFDLIASDT